MKNEQDQGFQISGENNGLFKFFLRLYRIIISAADRFYADRGFSKSAALAYSSLFSLVPAVTLALGVLAGFAVSSKFLPEVRAFLFQQFVPTPETVDEILKYLNSFSEALANLHVFVIVFVVFTSLLLISTVERSLNEIWEVYESRPLAFRIAIFCSIIVLGPLLAFSVYYFTKVQLQPVLEGIGTSSPISVTLGFLLPVFIDFSAFVALYYLVPKAPVKLLSALTGAGIAAILFSIAKGSFALYIASFASFNKVYGTVAAIPTFLLWLYLLWIIVLFGAECAFQAQTLPSKGRVWKRSLRSVGDATYVMALQALIMIGRAFKRGKAMPDELALAEKLGCSTAVLKPALRALEKHGIIARGDSRAMPFTLLKAPEVIEVRQLASLLYSSPDYRLKYTKELSAVFKSHSQEQGEIFLADIL